MTTFYYTIGPVANSPDRASLMLSGSFMARNYAQANATALEMAASLSKQRGAEYGVVRVHQS